MNIILSEIGRDTFHEGRSYGLGMAFAKKVSMRTYKASQPISACKDFLNDEIYSEITGREYIKHGQKSFKKNLFDEKYAYVIISFLPCSHQNGSKEKFEKDLNHYREYVKNITSLVRYMERKLKLPNRSLLYPTQLKDIYLIKVPIFWVKNSYLFSLYGLLLRNTVIKYSGENLHEYFKNVFNILPSDKFYIPPNMIKYLDKYFYKDTVLHNSPQTKEDPHNNGFITYFNKNLT